VSEQPTGIFEAAVDAEATAQAVAAAAPVAAERANLAMVHSLDAELREPMFALLSSLADNKYVLGRRYAEWCTGAPMLESAVAAAAMAQDELGHARSFYPLLRGFNKDPQMEEKGWQSRPTNAMTCLDAPFTTWAEYVAANLLVDGAMTTLLAAATDSPYEPLRQRARKIVQEERAHQVHGSGWARRIDVGSAIERMRDHAFTWFGGDDDPALAPLATAGLLSRTPDQLRQALHAALGPLARERDLPWDRWDPVRRRLRG
jgi:1,2-phenylacetyl-CoA epoxidase catalytic subunit